MLHLKIFWFSAQILKFGSCLFPNGVICRLSYVVGLPCYIILFFLVKLDSSTYCHPSSVKIFVSSPSSNLPFLCFWTGSISFAVTKSGKSVESTVRGWLPQQPERSSIAEYAADFSVPADFGCPGAILVTNLHRKEFYLVEIVIHGFNEGPIFFSANTWIHTRKDNPGSRIIFRNQVNLWKFSSLYFLKTVLFPLWKCNLNRRTCHRRRHLGLKIFALRT